MSGCDAWRIQNGRHIAREARVIPSLKKSGVKDSPGRDELIVVGCEQVAIAWVRLGQLLNFAVTIVDPLLGVSDLPAGVRLLNTLDFSLLTGDSERHVVVASRGKFDEEAVEQALHEQSAYVRLVASKKRVLEILRSLESKGESPKRLDTVHVLAGNNIWAETPQEIALSVPAEMVSRGTEKLLARNS